MGGSSLAVKWGVLSGCDSGGSSLAVAGGGSSLAVAVGGPLWLGCSGFSSQWLLLLWRVCSRACMKPSVVVGHGRRCPVARGIFPDQGLNPCPLHWQAVSYHWTTGEVWECGILKYHKILCSSWKSSCFSWPKIPSVAESLVNFFPPRFWKIWWCLVAESFW